MTAHHLLTDAKELAQRSSARELLDNHATEDELMAAVTGALDVHKWIWCHVRPARTKEGWRTPITGHTGLPDLICARGGRILFIELKRAKQHLREDQRQWADAIGIEHHLTLRPADLTWFMGYLKRLSK